MKNLNMFTDEVFDGLPNMTSISHSSRRLCNTKHRVDSSHYWRVSFGVNKIRTKKGSIGIYQFYKSVLRNLSYDEALNKINSMNLSDYNRKELLYYIRPITDKWINMGGWYCNNSYYESFRYAINKNLDFIKVEYIDAITNLVSEGEIKLLKYSHKNIDFKTVIFNHKDYENFLLDYRLKNNLNNTMLYLDKEAISLDDKYEGFMLAPDKSYTISVPLCEKSVKDILPFHNIYCIGEVYNTSEQFSVRKIKDIKYRMYYENSKKNHLQHKKHIKYNVNIVNLIYNIPSNEFYEKCNILLQRTGFMLSPNESVYQTFYNIYNYYNIKHKLPYTINPLSNSNIEPKNILEPVEKLYVARGIRDLLYDNNFYSDYTYSEISNIYDNVFIS